MQPATTYHTRPEQIFLDYLDLLDAHLLDFRTGVATEMWEIHDFAERLFVHPTHLSNVVKELTGNHLCHYFEQKLLVIAKELLADSRLTIAGVASQLTFDPSNFTKWFKAFTGQTPTAYRKSLLAPLNVSDTEMLTRNTEAITSR
jgi:AraC-like DNA-binding protein